MNKTRYISFSVLTLYFVLVLNQNCLTFASSILTKNKTSSEIVLRNVTDINSEPAPILDFGINVTRIDNGLPFRASCNIIRLTNADKKNYIVAYYRTFTSNNKQLLGKHEIFAPTTQYPNGRNLFTREIISDSDVVSGDHFTFPNFDVIVKPKSVSVLAQNYWCELIQQFEQEDDLPIVVTTISNRWVRTPIAVLSIDKVSGTTNQFLARCTVKDYEESKIRKYAYYVRFFLPRTGQSIAFYRITPGKPTELQPYSGSGRNLLNHGNSFSYPIFEIFFQVVSSLNENYACQLSRSATGINGDWETVVSVYVNNY